MNEFLRRLRHHFHRREFEADLEEEMRHHVSLSGGKQFGNFTQLKEESRSMWTWTWIEQFAQDLRYAVRSMLANKTFTALAVLSLALGIGANTAIFSFTESILLRALPVPNAASLVALSWNTPPPAGSKQEGPRDPPVVRLVFAGSAASYSDPRVGQVAAYFPYAAFELFQQEDTPFQNVFAYVPGQVLSVQTNGSTEMAEGIYVSGGYFSGLRVIPAAGRFVAPDDDRTGAPIVAVLSHSYWTRQFGNSPEVIGRTIQVNKTTVTIVGVAPQEFFGVDPEMNPDLYLPLHSNVTLNAGTPMANLQGWYTNPHFYWVEMMARLKPGVTREQAQAAMAPRFHNLVLSTAGPDERNVLPALWIGEGVKGLNTLRRQYAEPLYVLMTVVGLILAIACANIANLLLARAASRKQEMAVRLSMGAGRWRVIRQLLTESVLLASLGGVAGVALAVAGIRFLTLLLANGRAEFTLRAELNWIVLAAACGLSLMAGLVFGLAPALAATRVDVMPALKATRGDSTTQRRRWFGANLSQALLAGQIAMSLLLLVVAGLFVRTLSNLQTNELGFNRENLLLFPVSAQEAGVPGPEMPRFHADLLTRLARIPGVRDAAYSNLALIGGGSMSTRVNLPGSAQFVSNALYVGPRFFETMQIPLVSGRFFSEQDRNDSPAVAIVNEAFARKHLGGGNAIGRTIASSAVQGTVTIVGVAANTRYRSVKDDFAPAVFLPAAQAIRPQARMTYALRTAGDPMALVNSIREAIRQVDPRLSVSRIQTQEQQINRMVNQEIVFAGLCSGFALLALSIAAVGIYATTAYNVARRSGEIGIRMALGAQRERVLRMILRDVAVLSAIGLLLGVPAALALSRLVESFLFQIKPNDPLTLAAAVGVFVVAALLAAYLPARRASRIDPMAALRHE